MSRADDRFTPHVRHVADRVADELAAAENAISAAAAHLARARVAIESLMHRAVDDASSVDTATDPGANGSVSRSHESSERPRTVVRSQSPNRSGHRNAIDRSVQRSVTDRAGEVPASALERPIALPSRPGSMRWFAGQILNERDDEMAIAELAAEMRRVGYRHSHDPGNPQQLEQSLAALPNQLDWIVRGRVPGTLALDRDRIARHRR